MGNSGLTIYNNTEYPLNIYLSMGAPHHYCNSIKPKEAFLIRPGAVWYTVNACLDFIDNRMNDSKVAKGVAWIAVPAVVAGLTAVITGGASLIAASIMGGAEAASLGTFLAAVEAAAFFEEVAVFGALGTALNLTSVALGVQEAINSSESFENLRRNPKFINLMNEFEDAVKNSKYQVNIKGVYCGGEPTYLSVSGGPKLENGHWVANDLNITYCQRSEIPQGTKLRKRNDPMTYWDDQHF